MDTLLADLAMILIVAGITALIFKKLRQPLVLGYIVAGFLTSPNFTYFPTIANKDNVETWAEIGVIFLMFSLGLEFSFYKLKKVGSSAFIATGIAVLDMIIIGYLTGNILGWSRMNSLFLGGMLSMSSTAIIFKAFDDLGLKQENFANFVLGVLIIEDIAGIVMMVLLSTIATASANVSLLELLPGIGNLVFCLILWFVLGMYIVPSFFKRYNNLFNDETLLIVAVGLCLSMVIIAEHAGFSSALGAFIMGSLIAEAPSAERIEELFKPVKDLFGAVFFVSVGMLVDPILLWQYIIPVLILIVVTIVGQITSATLGMLAAGQSLKNAIRSGCCLCQIGEFSFILAKVGTELGVTSDFLYPIIVAVSVITTFTTPFCMGFAEPLYQLVRKHLPRTILERLDQDEEEPEAKDENAWLELLKSYALQMLIFSVLLTAISLVSEYYLLPYLNNKQIPFANYIAAALTLIAMAPILAKLLQNHQLDGHFAILWYKRRANHIPITALILSKFVLAVMSLYFVFHSLAQWHGLICFFCIIVAVYGLSRCRWVISQYLRLESTFLVNLNEKHMQEHHDGDITTLRESLDQQLQIVSYNVKSTSPLIGKSLKELSFYQNYHCNIIRIATDSSNTFMPGGDDKLVKNSRFTIIGMPQDIEIFKRAIRQEQLGLEVRFHQRSLRDYMLDKEVPKELKLFIYALQVKDCPDLLGKTIRNTPLRNQYNCMIVSVDRGAYNLAYADANLVLEKKDLLWILGQPNDIKNMILKLTVEK